MLFVQISPWKRQKSQFLVLLRRTRISDTNNRECPNYIAPLPSPQMLLFSTYISHVPTSSSANLSHVKPAFPSRCPRVVLPDVEQGPAIVSYASTSSILSPSLLFLFRRRGLARVLGAVMLGSIFLILRVKSTSNGILGTRFLGKIFGLILPRFARYWCHMCFKSNKNNDFLWILCDAVVCFTHMPRIVK
jgi:hypothetical protein